MSTIELLKRELRFPHVIGSLLILGLVVSRLPTLRDPLLVAVHGIVFVVAVAVAFERVPRYQLFPVIGIIAVSFGAYAYLFSEARALFSFASIFAGLVLLLQFRRIRRSGT